MNFLLLHLIIFVLPSLIVCDQENNYFVKIHNSVLTKFNIFKTLDYIGIVDCASWCTYEKYLACQLFFIDSQKTTCYLGNVIPNTTSSLVSLENKSVLVSTSKLHFKSRKNIIILQKIK